MQTIKRYSNRINADVDKARLESAGIPALVVGLGTSMEGGMGGIQLQVADENVEAALTVLDSPSDSAEPKP